MDKDKGSSEKNWWNLFIRMLTEKAKAGSRVVWVRWEGVMR